MGTVNQNGEGANERRNEYERIETLLGTTVDKLCMMEQLADFETELGEIQEQLQQVEEIARHIDNDRLATLSRAVQLLLAQVARASVKEVRPDTYAFLVYSVKTIAKLASISKYAVQTGYDIPDASYGEAIGAIIDHTEELSHPQMGN
ncbi:MAG: hypothetical protein JXR76_21890 [Deltaproteobacteria bacterium]|nr:hypothetical protein [Deltaproteobacteria bacterium]